MTVAIFRRPALEGTRDLQSPRPRVPVDALPRFFRVVVVIDGGVAAPVQPLTVIANHQAQRQVAHLPVPRAAHAAGLASRSPRVDLDHAAFSPARLAGAERDQLGHSCILPDPWLRPALGRALNVQPLDLEHIALAVS